MEPLRKPAPPITLVPRQSRIEEPPPPFWPRVIKATAVLSAAVIAHTWLIQAPQSRPSPFAAGVPGFAPHVAAKLVGETVRTGSPARAKAAPGSGGNVRVEHTIVEAVPAPRFSLRRPESPHPLPYRSAGAKRPSPKPDDDAVIVHAIDPEPPPASERSEIVEARPAAATPLALNVPSTQLLSTVELTDVPGALAAPAGEPARPRPAAPEPRAAKEETVTVSASPVDPEAELRKQEEIVRQVLSDYRQAYERLDVSAAKALWPTLDVRALQNAFKNIEAQQLRFGTCVFRIKGQDANARCPFEATYRPKVGSRVVRVTESEYRFDLSRNDAGWQIVNATVH